MKKCPNCGAECDDEANFCTECEADLRENAGAVPEDVIEDTEAPIAEEAPAVAAAPPPPAQKAAAAAPVQKAVAAATTQAAQTGPVFFSGNKAQGGQPNQPLPGQTIQQRVESHIVKALISTLCCCPPFGIAAIIFSTQVEPRLRANDLEGALEASKKANLWSNLAIALALLFITVSLITGMIQDGGTVAETFLNMYNDR